MEANNLLKIAVVDDDKDMTHVYSKLIERLGYPYPSVFHDGTSIVKALTADHRSFDVIIMDYQMPEMNGIEAAKIIQTHRKEAKIILATAQGSVKQQALDAGLSFIEKPFSMKQLARTLDLAKPDLVVKV
jgi:two-component system chemotaxis response regulator CheY